MNKMFLAIFLIILSSVFVFAQNSEDYKKGEFFVGYSSAQRIDDAGGPYTTARGFNTAGVYNFSRYVGIKGEVSGIYTKKRSIGDTSFFNNSQTRNVIYQERESIYNFAGGVQVKDNSTETRFKPFAHALAGVGQYRFRVSDINCSATVGCLAIPPNLTNTGFALVLGGGLDIKVSDKIDVRVVQIDLNTISHKHSPYNDTNNATFRFSAGIVFK